MALGLENSKSDIIELIDGALIEPKEREELKTEIQKQSAELFR
jgi:hypothetical protein